MIEPTIPEIESGLRIPQIDEFLHTERLHTHWIETRLMTKAPSIHFIPAASLREHPRTHRIERMTHRRAESHFDRFKQMRIVVAGLG
jgi:hypothetical protein